MRSDDNYPVSRGNDGTLTFWMYPQPIILFTNTCHQVFTWSWKSNHTRRMGYLRSRAYLQKQVHQLLFEALSVLWNHVCITKTGTIILWCLKRNIIWQSHYATESLHMSLQPNSVFKTRGYQFLRFCNHLWWGRLLRECKYSKLVRLMLPESFTCRKACRHVSPGNCGTIRIKCLQVFIP